jgi:hypothetical protein
MRRLISACAVCAVAVGLVAVPNALGVKSAKQVGGTVSVSVTPTTFTTGDTTVTTATVSGTVASSSNCRKDRTVHFAYVNGATVTPLAETAVTKGNGAYTATVPRPTDTNPPTTSVTLRATVDAAIRKVGSKKKGKKTKKGRAFNCLSITGDSAPITIAPAPTPTV